MKNTKLISKLKLLDKEELGDFSRFIDSSSYNKNKDAVRLFEYLRAKGNHPVYSSEKLDKDYIVRKLFSEWKKNPERQMSYLMTILSDLVDKFIVFAEVEYDEFEHKQLLLKAYKRRQGDKFFDATVKTFQRDLDKSPERGVNYYFHQYRLNHERYTHHATRRVEVGVESLENTIKNLDLFYFGTKLRYSCEVRFRELQLSEKRELILLDEIMTTTNHPLFEDKPLIRVFSAIVRLYQKRDKNIYDQLKSLTLNCFDQFDKIEQHDIVSFVNNFCILEFNKGHTEYLAEIFEWYKHGLDHNVWIMEGHIEHAVFDNIVVIACRLSELEWVEQFIRMYSKYLREDVEENVKTMAQCRLAFAQNKFKQVLELLNDIEFIDSIYKINAESYTLQCYYELEGYEDAFYSKCDAFAKRCRRDKVISKEVKQLVLNFISMIRLIREAKYKGEGKEELLNKLKEKPAVFSTWLTKIIERDI